MIRSKNAIGETVLSTVWKETHAYSLNGVLLIWRYLRDFAKGQTAKLKPPPNMPHIQYHSLILHVCSNVCTFCFSYPASYDYVCICESFIFEVLGFS